jgi:hypothetical protein
MLTDFLPSVRHKYENRNVSPYLAVVLFETFYILDLQSIFLEEQRKILRNTCENRDWISFI